MIISTAPITSLLLPSLIATTPPPLLHAPQDPDFRKRNAAAASAGRATSAIPGRLAHLPHVSAWRRRLDEDQPKRCLFVDFTNHTITTQAFGARSVVAADLDGDDDLDVLSASGDDDKIAWYENLDGTGEFSTPQVIFTTHGARSVAAADIDGDNGFDVLSASWNDNKIAWYENLDGAGDFLGPQRVITTRADGANSVATADLDGDADLDVLSTSWKDDKVAWYENMDGAGDFSGPQRNITTQADGATSVTAADLDGDTDLDVLLTPYLDDKITWFENLDGAGNFSGPQRVITTQTDGARTAVAADLDGDADLDVLSASAFDDKIAWYKNLDGAGDFSAPQRVITTQADGAWSVAAADLDGDGDLDILSASREDDKVAWYENLNGAGDFSGPRRIITTQADFAWSVAAADLDGDADFDMLSASEYDNKIAWYENLCEPITTQPTPRPTSRPTRAPTPEPTSQPTPEPTYWGAQVLGKMPQTANFERACLAWCVIFGIISVVVLGYVVHASQHKDKNLARIILTIILSQYDYGSDTLFIAFQNFVTPTLFLAALVTYLLPLVVFIVVYRRVVGVHLAHIYASTKANTIVRYDLWDELPKAFAEIGSFALFPFALATSTLVYVMLLFVFISCKLMSVSFFAVKFFETGGLECTQEAFEVMFKRNIFSELVFESTGELIIVLVDTTLRAQQDFRSNTGLSSWAVLSIVGSSLMLMIEVWPYMYQIIWMGLGLDAGIAAVSTNLKFTPDEVLGTRLIDRLVRLAGLFAPRGQAVNDKSVKDKYRSNSEVHDINTFELAEQCEQ